MEILVILAVLMGLAAIGVTLLRKTNNSQAIRACSVVGIFVPAMWVSLAALVWALIEYFGITASVSSKPVKKKK